MFSDDWVYFQVAPTEMTMVTRIMEGYEYIGVVTALDGKCGLGYVRTTRDTAPLAREILQALPVAVRICSFASPEIQKYTVKCNN